MDPFDLRSSAKSKKPKSFKFLQKKEKDRDEKDKDEKRDDRRREDKKKEIKKEEKQRREKDDKEKKKEKVDKKEEKKKEKEEKKREKEEKKRIKKDKKRKVEYIEVDEAPVFGIPLAQAVERCPSHDGIRLPAIVRECIDFIEEYGLHCEGIYRLSGVKSKVQHLRRAYSSGFPVKLSDYEPHVVASLLKQFLRELPEPVLTRDMMPHFEDVSLIPNPSDRAEAMRQLIDRLPVPNQLLVQYIFKHMGHVIDRAKDTKMTYQNVCIVLSPTMQISHRVLNVMFQNHVLLFSNVKLKKYIPPITSCGPTQRSLESLETLTEIEEEIMKQESLLGFLHEQIRAGFVSRRKEEQLWETQRIVTLLKRKLKIAKRRAENHNKGDEEASGQERDLSSEESQKDLATSEVKTNEVQMEITKESQMEVSEDVKLDSYHAENLESETVEEIKPKSRLRSEGRSHAADHVEANVTVVNIGKKSDEEERKDCVFGVEGTENIPEESLTQISHAENEMVPVQTTQQSDHTILPLQKPVSALIEKPKLMYHSTVEEREELAAEELKLQSMTDRGGKISDASLDHVTVIQVGEAVESVEVKEEVAAPTGRTVKETCNLLQTADDSTKFTSQSKHQHIMKAEKDLIIECLSLEETRSQDDMEYQLLLEQEALASAEHEELLSMNHDLTRKLQAERAEISRLQDEIQEKQTIYGYRTHSYDSSESEGSESEGESDTEEDMLQQQATILEANTKLQEENVWLTEKIQEEREAVVHLRALLRQAHSRHSFYHSFMTTVC